MITNNLMAIAFSRYFIHAKRFPSKYKFQQVIGMYVGLETLPSTFQSNTKK